MKGSIQSVITRVVAALFGTANGEGPSRRRLLGWLLAVLGPPALTVGLVPVRNEVGLPTALLVYLALVVAVAVTGGVLAATFVAVVAFLLGNRFFTEPVNTWVIHEPSDVVSLMVFLGVALVVSMLVRSNLRRSEEALRAHDRAARIAEANDLRTALLRAVSHDLNTPLSSIKAAITSLRQTDVDWDSAAVSEFHATIDEETDRLTSLVSNLLDMSRLEAGALEVNLEPVVLEEVAAAATPGLGRGRGQIELDVPDSLPAVRADAALLERAVANLLANACRHSPTGAPVRIIGRRTSDGVALTIVDQGPGVPPGEREQIFEPFHRLGDTQSGGGSGLGLAVARGFLRAMGIAIDLGDTPGGGLTVTLGLKMAERSLQTAGPDDRTHRGPARRQTAAPSAR